jgi:hypothetical protein
LDEFLELKLRNLIEQCIALSTIELAGRLSLNFLKMKIDLLLTLTVLGSFKDLSISLVSAKSVQSENISNAIESSDDCRHSNSTSECVFDEGEAERKC